MFHWSGTVARVMPSPLVIMETLWGYNPINFPRSLGFRQARPRIPRYPPSPGWRNAEIRPAKSSLTQFPNLGLDLPGSREGKFLPATRQ